MASGLLALFDDVATLFDDMATMSKVATQKTAGILGDDLAVAAEQASGYAASRELPVLARKQLRRSRKSFGRHSASTNPCPSNTSTTLPGYSKAIGGSPSIRVGRLPMI